MKYRKLRIAWSVVWGVVAVLLVVLWVRSYSRSEAIHQITKGGKYLSLTTSIGRLILVTGFAPRGAPPGIRAYSFRLDAIGPHFLDLSTQPALSSILGVQWQSSTGIRPLREFILVLPFWFLSLIPIAFILVVNARTLSVRFSLRTLLIATTLVAVGLGVVVWMTR